MSGNVRHCGGQDCINGVCSPSSNPGTRVPLVALIVSVIVPDEFVNREDLVAGAPAKTRNCEVTEVGA